MDLLVTEALRDLEEVYMTVRPGERKSQSHSQSHSSHSRRRSREGESCVMYDKKFSMDSDYREYYRDRPRGGEFLTRGAALSAGPSQARGRQQQYQQVANTARIGRNASSEKIATARNPTILRKSESDTLDII